MSVKFVEKNIPVNTQSSVELISRMPLAGNLPDIAKELGLVGFFVTHKTNSLGNENVTKDDGMYFVICRDEQIEKEFYNIMHFDKDKLKDILDSIDVERRTVNTKYAMIPFNYITDENDFMIYQRTLRTIHDLSAAKAAYGEQGFRPPEYIVRETLDAIHTFINKRYDPNIPQNMRDIQAEGMRKFIKNSVKRYEKDEPVRHKTLRPHEVRRDYFFKNHIKCVNDGISANFLRYLKTRWDECPDFVMYRERKPFINHKNHSKTPEKIAEMYPGMEDYWADLGRERIYRIAYPAYYEQQFDAWKFDYIAKKNNWQFITPLAQIDKDCKMKLIEVDAADVDNWASLCAANGIKCAINHGELGKVHGTTTYGFIYSDKDANMIKAIQARLIRETSAMPKEYVVPGKLYYLSTEQLKDLDEKDKVYEEKLAAKEAKREAGRDKFDAFFGKRKEKKVEQQKPETIRGMGYCSGYDEIDF